MISVLLGCGYFTGWLILARCAYRRLGPEGMKDCGIVEAMCIGVVWPLLLGIGGPLWLLGKMVTTDLPKIRHRPNQAYIAELQDDLGMPPDEAPSIPCGAGYLTAPPRPPNQCDPSLIGYIERGQKRRWQRCHDCLTRCEAGTLDGAFCHDCATARRRSAGVIL